MNIVPTDSPSVFAALNTLVLDQAQFAIVRPDNPPPGIAGFLFDLPGDDGSELESDIPDHYVEDNTPVQDQIVLRPEIVTVSAEVAELVRQTPANQSVAAVSNPLPMIDGLSPELSPGAEEEQEEFEQVAQEESASVSSAETLYGYYSRRSPPQPNQTKQSVIYGYIYQLWKGRQLFSVETPWGFFTNMAILSVSVRQDERTRVVSEFSITFKKIRTVSSVAVNVGNIANRATSPRDWAGRAVPQRSSVTQNGTVGQVPLSTDQRNQQIPIWADRPQ